MKKFPAVFFMLSFFFAASAAHAVTPGKIPSKKKSSASQSVRSEAGLNIPEWGIAVDAFFDPRLTDLVPGYHIVNIVLTNRRGMPVMLDPSSDKWIIVDNAGKKHTARNHAQQLGDNVWEKLPKELRSRLSYPVTVKPGKIATIDVFLPKSAELENFREVIWKSRHFSKEFNIYTNTETALSLSEENRDVPDLPAPQSAEPYTDEDYLKSREEVLNPTAQDPDRWEKDAAERERKKLEETLNFDPSFDDAIIIR